MGEWFRLIIAAFRRPLLPDPPPKYGMCPKCYRMAPLEHFEKIYRSARKATNPGGLTDE